MSPVQKKRAAELLRMDADYLMQYCIRPAEKAIARWQAEHVELSDLAEQLDDEADK